MPIFSFSRLPCSIDRPALFLCGACGRAAARMEDRRIRDDSTLPPDILSPGARHSQDAKCSRTDRSRTLHRCEGQGWSWPVDLGQVDPGNTEERGADIE